MRKSESALAAARRRLTAWQEEAAHPKCGLDRGLTREVVRQLEDEVRRLEAADPSRSGRAA